MRTANPQGTAVYDAAFEDGTRKRVTVWTSPRGVTLTLSVVEEHSFASEEQAITFLREHGIIPGSIKRVLEMGISPL